MIILHQKRNQKEQSTKGKRRKVAQKTNNVQG